MLAEGLRLFYLEQFAEAQVVFENGIELAEGSGVANPWTYPHHSWLVATLRRQAETTSHWNPDQRIALLKRARKVARKAVRIARKFQNDLPLALREAGLVAAMQGSTRKARRHLDESLAVAERQGARFEHAQTLLARGRIGLELGWPEAEQDVDDGPASAAFAGGGLRSGRSTNGGDRPCRDSHAVPGRSIRHRARCWSPYRFRIVARDDLP